MTSELIAAARAASKRAYCPYSHFAVGAALLTGDGSVFTGCNVENASFGGTICAERTALLKAVSEGHREFTALAVAAGNETPGTPCGLCLQILVEFCPPDMPVYCVPLSDSASAPLKLTLHQCMPNAFTGQSLGEPE